MIEKKRAGDMGVYGMNVVDLIIIGAIGLVALMGLKYGILKPVSGVGGLILGVVLALQYHSEVAILFSNYLDGVMAQRIASLVAIVLVVAIISRTVAWLIRKLLYKLFLEWVDHLAGAMGGAALGILIAGTMVYLLSGINSAPAREVLDSSALAPQVSQASLVSASAPWCSVPAASGGQAGGCTDLKGIISDLLGEDIDNKVNELLGGHEAGTLVEVVKRSLGDSSSEQLVQLVKSEGERQKW